MLKEIMPTIDVIDLDIKLLKILFFCVLVADIYRWCYGANFIVCKYWSFMQRLDHSI